MKDILNFKDDLITLLFEQEQINPGSLVDITDFARSYFPNILHITTVVNDLFSHPNGGYGLITSDMNLGPMGFNQQYFKRNVVPPLRARITPSGKKYYHEIISNGNKKNSIIFQNSTAASAIDKLDWEKAYSALWKAIGPKESANYYISGPQFYKLIMEMCDNIPSSYTNFIEYRKKEKLSTSRIDYYKDLIDDLSEDKRKEIYQRIQQLINMNMTFQKTPEKIENPANSKAEFFENSIMLENNQDTIPSVFISYSWDDLDHQNWVLKLATKLMENGVEVIYDKWDLLPLGKLLPNFMEDSIEKSDRVICIMTPNYKKKTDQLKGGVGYEYSIITSEILYNGIKTTKFIPLLRHGLEEEAIPIALKGRVYVDMRDDSLFEAKLMDELLRDIYQEPKYKKPPVGKKPIFNQSHT